MQRQSYCKRFEKEIKVPKGQFKGANPSLTVTDSRTRHIFGKTQIRTKGLAGPRGHQQGELGGCNTRDENTKDSLQGDYVSHSIQKTWCFPNTSGLPKHFWAEAVNMTCYLINRSPWKSLDEKVVEERSKLDAKLKECIFLGYKTGFKGFKFWDLVAKKIVTSRDVVFDEQSMLQIIVLPKTGYDPVTFHDAVTSQENGKWMAAMVEEMKSLNHNRTWELVRIPEGKKPIEQMDVKTAFLHDDLEDQIYMQLPEGFTQPGKEHLVCRLKKYFLDDGSFIFLLLYVDDMLIAAKNMDDVIGLKTLLSQEFDMKDLGTAKKILGIEICMDRDSRKLWLSQRGYVEKMLKRFAMSSAKLVSTPLANHFKLSSEQFPKTNKEAEYMEKVPYSNDVGCLMYAMVCTCPDLAHVVSQVCKYMSKPGKQHWEVVKWIFRYLKGTVGHGIVFGSQRDNPLVVGYVDSDYAGDLDNRRSTTWYVFTLGGWSICWKSTVQSVVELFTTKAEYMAVAEAAKETLWLTGLVKELGVQQGGVQLRCDNQSTI
ncbi:putative ribonuclease H protein [Hibiscus syriacus]|uniref:Ribonuclease H protein n=1 Tax=Hibiscus syriacus TaxID=106335 RepID=A0A6A3BUA3_HIBSY|nr:putative ribonuclease H protein [Hibiscus syriacus]